MKKFILSMFVMTSFGAYTIWQNTGNSFNNFVVPTLATNSTKKGSNRITLSPTTTVKTPISGPQNKNGGMGNGMMGNGGMMNNRIYNDGSYTGSLVDAYYGNIQVKAIISGGRLIDVQFLDYPQDRGTSIRINSYALPILKKEAISAQSANVNAVSGASETSPAFVKSLTFALNQAKI